MIGAILGDIAGSAFDDHPQKTKHFHLFQPGSRYTDDTVLTVAVADSILTNRTFSESLKLFGCRYPNAGYGKSFNRWLTLQKLEPYNSWGNGSAMRVSPVGYAFDTVDEILHQAEASALPTHNHPEGIKGAQAVALAIFLARTGSTKLEIKEQLVHRFGYDLDRTIDLIRPGYSLDISCMGSVPEAIIAFLEATSMEDAVRTAISLGGDSDTQACIAGAIAESYFGVVDPEWLEKIRCSIPQEFNQVIDRFYARYVNDVLFPRYIFRSNRLGFRTWRESDGRPFAQLNSDSEVMAYFPKRLTEMQSALFIERIMNHFHEYGYGLFAVEELETGEFIGFIGFQNAHFEADFTPCVEIGWRLARKFWGKGYATEGALACLDYGFNQLKFSEIASFTADINVRSINVMKRSGMKLRSRFNHPNISADNHLSAHVLYWLERHEYFLNLAKETQS